MGWSLLVPLVESPSSISCGRPRDVASSSLTFTWERRSGGGRGRAGVCTEEARERVPYASRRESNILLDSDGRIPEMVSRLLAGFSERREGRGMLYRWTGRFGGVNVVGASGAFVGVDAVEADAVDLRGD